MLFTKTRADLKKRLPAAKRTLARGGSLWICWPSHRNKGSSMLNARSESHRSGRITAAEAIASSRRARAVAVAFAGTVSTARPTYHRTHARARAETTDARLCSRRARIDGAARHGGR